MTSTKMQWIRFETEDAAAVRNAERDFRLARAESEGGIQIFAWAERTSRPGSTQWRVESRFMQYLRENNVPFELMDDDATSATQ
jgi:hypothetical protein